MCIRDSYTLDGNAQFPIAVNAVNPNKPLPLIVGIGYVSDKAYAIEERMRDYTFPDVYKRQVLLSFDDGYETMYNVVFPLLKAYNYPAEMCIRDSTFTY